MTPSIKDLLNAEAPNYLSTVVNQHLKEASSKQDDFIKSKFIEKGFGHLVEGLRKKLFPKIAAIKANGWTYWYADNNTEEGAFIVAIQDWHFEQPDVANTELAIKMHMSFKWQDSQPLKEYQPYL